MQVHTRSTVSRKLPVASSIQKVDMTICLSRQTYTDG